MSDVNKTGIEEEQTHGGFFESLCKTPLPPNERPSHLEILLPPGFILIVFILSALYLNIRDIIATKRRNATYKYLQPRDPTVINNNENGCAITNVKKNVLDDIIGDGEFLSSFDKEIIQTTACYYNHTRNVMQICVPAFLSLILTAVTLMLHQPVTACLWPGRVRPDINTALACFLAPAGLIYALTFGFTFQLVLEKHKGVLNKITNELSMIDQLATMTSKMRFPTTKHDMAMLKAIKSEAIFLGATIQNREPSDFKAIAPKNLKVHIWSVIDVLRDAASHPEYKFNINRILADKMLKYIIHLNNICVDRLGVMHARIHPFKWVFLEVLGGIVVIGVMLIDATSRRLELTVCEVTIFSTSMLCYVLADLDSPFSGFFRVDLDVLDQVIDRLEIMYIAARGGIIEGPLGQNGGIKHSANSSNTPQTKK